MAKYVRMVSFPSCLAGVWGFHPYMHLFSFGKLLWLVHKCCCLVLLRVRVDNDSSFHARLYSTHVTWVLVCDKLHVLPKVWCSKHPLCDPPIDFLSPACLVFVGPSTHSMYSVVPVQGLLTNFKCSTLSWWCSWHPQVLTDQVKYSQVNAVSAPRTLQLHSNPSLSVTGSALCFLLPKPCSWSSVALPFRTLWLASN